MIKYFPLLNLLFVFLMVKNEGYAQDLIERTQQNIPKSHLQQAPNELAKLVTANQKSSARFSEFDLFEISTTTNSLTENFVTGGVNLTIKSEQLDAFIQNKPENTTLKIPVDQKSTFELELFKVDIFSEDFIYRANDGENLTALANGVYYRGIVKGDNNSIASASIFGDEIRIMIGDNEGNYVIGKRKDNTDHVLYNDRNLLLAEPETCIAGEAQNLGKDGLRSQVESNSRNAMNKCIPIYVECDYDMYQKQGSSEANVIAFVGALINEVATIYANEQISISLSDVKVWTTTDPYASLNNTSAILQEFGRLTQNNYNGRLAHFISTRSLGGGIAWVDVLCSSYFTFSGQHAGPYAVSASMGTSITTFPTYSWNVEVFAHEMGHNMGSPHTQNCSWNGNNTAIDNCAPTEGGCASTGGACPPGGGTIMSYCHISNCGIDFNNGFGQQPGDLIRNRYNNASCTLTCAAPTCDDGVQNGDEEGVDCGGSNCNACPCYGSTVNFTLNLDQYPSETSWTLKNATGTPLYTGSGYNQSFATISQTFSLPAASGYAFSINDSFGDGICCGYGNGSFSLTDNNGEVIASGGAFGASFSTTFCTEGGNGPTDNCPNDPNKTAPGVCGCGVADTDSDNDGTPNCNDACPDDPNKITAGDCGCGVADTDSDEDGTLDCNDNCPNDRNKTEPGDCGCGIADLDDNNNGTSDCFENSICEENTTVSATFSPSTTFIGAQKVLTTTGNVTISNNMIFQAGETILLTEGFHAQAGSNFTSMIVEGGCAPNNSFENSASRINNGPVLSSSTDLKIAPNPFQANTTIQFNLSKEESVLIQVMDLNGRIIKVLVNNELKTAGYHEVQMERSNLQSGMYYVFLITKDQMISKKIVAID